MKFSFAQDILQGLALTAAAHQRTDFLQLGLAERPFKLQVERHPLQCQSVADQQFGVEPRRIDALPREEIRRFLDDI